MAELKILLSNLAYARGFSGALMEHLRYAHRHFYCSRTVQEKVLKEFKTLIDRETPDICCLVEIDRGRETLRSFNQLHALLDEHYRFSDIANKYNEHKGLGNLPILTGKCNAFCANQRFAFERVYLNAGYKRLVYKIAINAHLTLFFAHFSLRKSLRARQFLELRKLLDHTPGEHIVMGDFNIFGGIGELAPLLEGGSLLLLNNPEESTFRFHKRHQMLDLCLCSARLREHARLRVIPQAYSDHAALLLHLRHVAVDSSTATHSP